MKTGSEKGHLLARGARVAAAVGGLGFGLGGGLLVSATVGGAASAAAAGQLGLHPNHFSVKPGDGGSGASSIGWASSNWSGYAATSSAPYSGVTAQWKVPSVQPTGSATYSAAWTGIDGFTNNSLIQTGTEQDFYGGSAHYAAWWTTSAQNFLEQQITTGCTGSGQCGAVAPGDTITATITETNASTHAWTVTLTDANQSWSFTQSVTYTGPGASAEWIMEAPSIGGRIAPLAVYSSPVTFDPGTVNGGASPALAPANSGELVQGHSRRLQVVSIPSAPDADHDGFNISYGSTQPSAPAS
jgi:hypothetical protein